MKVTRKLFVIALLLSIVFAMSAVAAAENATFEQSNIMEEVSTETLSVSPDEIQELNTVEDESLVNNAEDNEILTDGETGTFSDIQSMINNAVDGETIYLDGKTYTPDNSQPISIDDNYYRELIIRGGSSDDPEKYATIDARKITSIFLLRNIRSISFYSINFYNGLTYDDGGAFHIDHCENMNFTNCNFINNTAHQGGAIYARGNELKFENCKFINNHAITGYGGSAYLDSVSTFKNSEFTDNSATLDGGSLHLIQDSVIENCNFINNMASSGGAINSEASINILYSNFTKNSATQAGALALYGVSRVKYSNFTNNSASLKGGAISSSSPDTEIWDSIFINNSAGQGGAIVFDAINGDILKIKNSKFNNNFAYYGGAIFNEFDFLHDLSYHVRNKYNPFSDPHNNRFYDPSSPFYSKYSDYNSPFYDPSNIYYSPQSDPYSSQYEGFYLGDDHYLRQFFDEFFWFMNFDIESNEWSRLEINGNTFLSNNANHGGAIYDEGVKTLIDNNIFLDNKASESDSNSLYMTYPILNNINDGYIYHNLRQHADYANMIMWSIGYSSHYYYDSYQTYHDYDYVVRNLDYVKSLSKNTINSDKAEILFDKSTFGLVKLKILDISSESFNKNVKFCEGINKMYATLTDGDGHKVSVTDSFYFAIVPNNHEHWDYMYSVDYKYWFNFNNGYCEIEYQAILNESEEMNQYQVFIRPENEDNFNVKNFMDVYWNLNLNLNVIPLEVSINFNDVTGNVGKTVQVPIQVTDSAGKPLDGSIEVSYNGNEKTIPLSNGLANVIISLPVSETTFDLIVKYGDVTQKRTVNAVKPAAEVPTNVVIILPNNVTGKVGQAVVVPVQVFDKNNNPLNGEITVQYQGREKTEILRDGSANIILTLPFDPVDFELSVSCYDAFAICDVYAVNENVAPISDDIVVIDLPDKMVGHIGKTVIIPVNVHDGLNNALDGTITVYYSGHEKTEALHNGKSDIVINLPSTPMEFDVIVQYGKTMETTHIRVIENITQPGDDNIVVIELEDMVGHTGKALLIPIYIHDGAGNGLDGDIKVFYNDQEKTLPLIEGRSSITLSMPITPTTFVFTVKYDGVSKGVFIDVVNPQNPLGDITNVDANKNNSLIIDLPNDATGNVNVTINGKTYPGRIVNGSIVIDIDDLPNGNYNGTVHYSGDENYSPSDKPINISINYSDVVDPENPMGDITNAETDNEGSVVIPFPEDAKGEVTITINGQNYSATVENGKAVVDVKDLPNDEYSAKVYYSGDGNYSNSTKYIQIVVNKQSSSNNDTTNPMSNITEAKSDDNGSVVIPFPEDAEGDVIVNIGGKIYTAKVVDGKVVLDTKDLPQGNYNSTVYYMGDGKYQPSTKTVMIYVKETITNNNNNQQNTPVKPPAAVKKASKITAKKKTFKANKKVKKYSITLKSGKTPIKKVQVTIKIGKKTFKANTNAKGKATFKIKKLTKKAKYNAVIKFKGNKTYKAASKKVKITIK
ncbi:hypothetical protein [Methanobrevibacter sp.]